MRSIIASGLMAAAFTVLPATAIAGPDEPQNQDQNEQSQSADDNQENQATDQTPELDRFEWSQTSGPRLGITVMGLTPDLRAFYGAPRDRGVVVARVEPRSPAARAGLRVGDILIGVQGQSVANAANVLGALSSMTRGERIPLTVIRDKETISLQAKLPSTRPTTPEANDC